MKTNLPSRLLMGCNEVRLHYKRPLFNSMVHIYSASDAVVVLRNYIDSCRLDLKEFFWVLLLSNANCVLGIAEIGVGATHIVVVNNKEIFQLALKLNASAFVICHNHPSGLLKISESDIKLTEKLGKISSILDMRLLDHIIITSESFVSFVEEGKL